MHLYKHKDAGCEKIQPTMGSFYNYMLRTFYKLSQNI